MVGVTGLLCAIPDRIWGRLVSLNDIEIGKLDRNEYVLIGEASEYDRGKAEGLHFAWRRMFWVGIVLYAILLQPVVPEAYSLVGWGFVLLVTLAAFVANRSESPEYRFLGETDDGVDPLTEWAPEGGD